MAERKIAAPPVNAETKPYWDACAAGRLLLKKCLDCGQAHWYPRAICPLCWSERTDWTEASGRGTIYSFSILRRAPVPYAIAYVTLDEGVAMMTNIVDSDFAQIRIGAPVEVVFKPSEGGPPVPMFKLR